MADLKNGNRQFEPLTIDKFKGIDTSIRDGALGYMVPGNEAYALDEAVSPDMSNFNINRDGSLVKRRGLIQVADLTPYMTLTPANNSMRLMGIQRVVTTNIAYLHLTDGLQIWRVRTDGTDIVRVGFTGGPQPGGDPAGSYEHVPFSGSVWPAYSCIGIRAGAGTSVQAVGGIFTLYGDAPTAGFYAPNSPPGTNLIYFKRRFWAINSNGGQTNNDEDRLWYSEPNDPANWGGAGMPNNIVFDRGGGDYMVSLIPYNDQLIVFKSRKTYVVTAEGDPTGWNVRLLSDRVGCIGRKTVKSINGFLYFLSHDGVYKSDGTTFELISGPVNDLIDRSRDFSNPYNIIDIMASYWDGKYILWTRRPEDASPLHFSCALVYDIELGVWTRWDFPGRTFLSEARFPDKFPDTLFLTEWGSKILWKMGPAVFSDGGAAIQSKWKSKKMVFGFPMQKTRNHLFGLSVRDDAGSGDGSFGNYSVKIHADERDPGSWQVQNPAGLSVANMKFRGAGYGRYFQTEIVHNGTGYTRIYDMTWMNEQRGLTPKTTPVKNP